MLLWTWMTTATSDVSFVLDLVSFLLRSIRKMVALLHFLEERREVLAGDFAVTSIAWKEFGI